MVQGGGDSPKLKLREACDRVESAGDEVSRAEAWHQVVDCLEGLVRPDDVVTSCEVEAISEDDFSYSQYRVSESLNFEAMSDTSVRPERGE